MSGRSVSEGYRGGVAITPSDSVIIAPTRGLFIGGAGNVTVDFVDGTSNVLLTGPEVGTVLPLSVVRVRATGTTATAIVALY